MDSEDDKECQPPGKKARSGKFLRTTSPEALKSKSHRVSFEEELESSQKSGLTKKKKVGGVRKKRLDPALQGLMGIG